MRDAWVIGSSNIDLTYRVKRIPQVGSTELADSLRQGTGGKGANQAIALAHWGIPVHFIGAVGDDETGVLLSQKLGASGVDTTHLVKVKGESSGSAVIYVTEQGDNCIVVHPGANRRVPADLPKSLSIGKNDLVIAQMETNLDAVEAAFARAADCGARAILNPSPIDVLPSEILQLSHTVIANEHEAAVLGRTSIDDVRSARECALNIMVRGPKVVAITLGPAGAVLVSATSSFHVAGIQTQIVDTQGAGDAFLGAFASRIAMDDDYAAAVRFANRVAAFCCTKHGSTQVSLPDADEVAALAQPVVTSIPQ